MKIQDILYLISLLFMVSCKSSFPAHQSEDLTIKALNKQLFVHISYLNSQNFGRVACNGLIYCKGKEAIIFDSPTDSLVSVALINWINKELKAEVKGIVINHFHVDCLGGLSAFHAKGIPSYAHQMTIQLAEEAGTHPLPQYGFEREQELQVGPSVVINRFFGGGHTRDNIVSYIPSEEALFGGCMVKSLKAGKGNLNDASVGEWATTVAEVRAAYPNLKWVIPGHGAVGGVDLLGYTIELFEGEERKGN